MKRRVVIVLLALAAGALLWLWPGLNLRPAARSLRGTDAEPPGPSSIRHVAESPTAAPPSVPISAPPTRASVARQRAAEAAALARSSGPETAPGLTPAAVLNNMRSVFRQYSSRFGGNPVGTNLEITRALNGGNPKQVVFLNPDDGMRVNEQGELVDNWGTPFFFHQLSSTVMEIHSAGPDRKMWTADDLVVR